MTEVTELQKAIVNDAAALRGSIITSYSQVEFLLADLSVKLNLKFPYLVKDRIKAAKKIGQRPGYESYRADLDRICDELLRFEEIRTFMAHGFLTVTTDRIGNHQLEYRMYQRTGDGTFNLVLITTTVPRLEEAAMQVTEYVSEAVRLFERVYREQKLEG